MTISGRSGAKGQYFPLRYRRASVEEAAAHRLVLVPGEVIRAQIAAVSDRFTFRAHRCTLAPRLPDPNSHEQLLPLRSPRTHAASICHSGSSRVCQRRTPLWAYGSAAVRDAAASAGTGSAPDSPATIRRAITRNACLRLLLVPRAAALAGERGEAHGSAAVAVAAPDVPFARSREDVLHARAEELEVHRAAPAPARSDRPADCESTSARSGTRDRRETSSRCRRYVPGRPPSARAASAAASCSPEFACSPAA